MPKIAFCVVDKEAMSRYLLAVASGCFSIEAIARPMVARFVPLKGSLPESKIVADLLGSEKPKDPALRPYDRKQN